ncbi:MAG: hypothetical protein LW703_10790 [Rhodobacter sp.]|jgi:hypothetical protein|nr:hypothetical protein [Rhodobacter sp.]
MRSTASDRLLAELDRVYHVLRSGKLEGLAAASQALETELAQLDPADGAGLDLLRHKAQRNAACLEAAARGVRAARRRLTEIRMIESGSGTYDDKGRRDELPGLSIRLTQRL